MSLSANNLDVVLRLLAATALGLGMGLERILRGKPTGIRTLGLVGFGSALVILALTHVAGIMGAPDPFSRVLQGGVQGVLIGIGFLGGGIILRDIDAQRVSNVTTAAEVWVIAALGFVGAIAPWSLIGLSDLILVVLVVLLRVLETRFGLKDSS